MTIATAITAKCLQCDWTGSTHRQAEKHTNDAGHATSTSMTPVKP